MLLPVIRIVDIFSKNNVLYWESIKLMFLIVKKIEIFFVAECDGAMMVDRSLPVRLVGVSVRCNGHLLRPHQALSDLTFSRKHMFNFLSPLQDCKDMLQFFIS